MITSEKIDLIMLKFCGNVEFVYFSSKFFR